MPTSAQWLFGTTRGPGGEIIGMKVWARGLCACELYLDGGTTEHVYTSASQVVSRKLQNSLDIFIMMNVFCITLSLDIFIVMNVFCITMSSD